MVGEKKSWWWWLCWVQLEGLKTSSYVQVVHFYALLVDYIWNSGSTNPSGGDKEEMETFCRPKHQRVATTRFVVSSFKRKVNGERRSHAIRYEHNVPDF